jgi:hypothetical protein
MSKQLTFGLFHGGDPRNFEPDGTIANENQMYAWRNACDKWTRAENLGELLSDEPSQEILNLTVTDYATADFGAGNFEVEVAAGEPKPPAELDEATFNEIMDGPVQPLPFRAVLG